MSQAAPLQRRLGRWAADARDLSLHHLLRALPTETCSDMGARLSGIIGRRGHPVAVARTQAVLARIRPDLVDPADLEAATSRLWENMGRIYAEYSVLARMVPEGRVAEADPGRLGALLAGPRPVICLFLHIGNWELAGQRVADLAPWRMIAPVMPPDSPVQAGVVARWRARLPCDVRLMHPRVWREVLERLRRPGGVAFIAGDEPNETSVSAPFFGHPPRTDGNLGKIVRLAAATGALIVPIYAERKPGVRFVIETLPPTEVAAGVRGEAAVVAQVLRIDAMLEPVIRRFADQWHLPAYFGKDIKLLAPSAGPASHARHPG